MNKKEINTSKYLYNPFDKESIEQLKGYDEFKDIKDDKVITYIILAYDYNSVIRKEYAIRSQQKVEAAKLAGFVFKNNQFERRVEEIMIGNKYDIDLAIVKYLSFFGRPELMALEFYYVKMNDLLINQLKGGVDKNSEKTMTYLVDEINKKTNIVFGGEEVLTARSALYDFVKKQERIMPRPESYKDIVESGESLKGNPYGEYEPTKDKNYLKFKGDN